MEEEGEGGRRRREEKEGGEGRQEEGNRKTLSYQRAEHNHVRRREEGEDNFKYNDIKGNSCIITISVLEERECVGWVW